MVKIAASPNYKDISNIYKHIMRKVRYDHWADYIYAISNRLLSSNPSVLELASGNCELAYFLSSYYPNIIASDLSFSMLSNLKKNKLKKVCFDMTSIPFQGKFDLIFSSFDSVNYLITKKKLSNFFTEIGRILNQKGVFTFDVSLENNSYKHIKVPVREGTYKNIKYKQQTDYDTKKRIHRNIFVITYPDGKTYREVHLQKIYPFETYFDVIGKADLVIRECFESFTCKDGSSKSSRVQFLVTKK